MAEFVYADGTLPSGKVDAQPLVGDPTKNVTAAEWNAVMQALQDLKTALLNAVGNTPGQINSNATIGAAAFQGLYLAAFQAFAPSFIDNTGTPGDVTDGSESAGIVVLPAGQTAVTVTVANDNVAAVLGAFVTPLANDANVTKWWVTLGGGSTCAFTIHVDMATAADMPFYYMRASN